MERLATAVELYLDELTEMKSQADDPAYELNQREADDLLEVMFPQRK